MDFIDDRVGADMNDKDKAFQVIASAHDDCRRQIAAGKVQRWEVVKWGVAVNVGLATAAAALGRNIPLHVILLLAVAVAIASLLLLGHYNKRMSGARRTATTLAGRLRSYHIDYDAILETDVARSYSTDEYYDWPELIIFSAIIGVSVLLVFVVAFAFAPPA